MKETYYKTQTSFSPVTVLCFQIESECVFREVRTEVEEKLSIEHGQL